MKETKDSWEIQATNNTMTGTCKKPKFNKTTGTYNFTNLQGRLKGSTTGLFTITLYRPIRMLLLLETWCMKLTTNTLVYIMENNKLKIAALHFS